MPETRSFGSRSQMVRTARQEGAEWYRTSLNGPSNEPGARRDDLEGGLRVSFLRPSPHSEGYQGLSIGFQASEDRRWALTPWQRVYEGTPRELREQGWRRFGAIDWEDPVGRLSDEELRSVVGLGEGSMARTSQGTFRRRGESVELLDQEQGAD
jgi:hypothetical protein